MNPASPKPRAHLVERAVEALGGAEKLDLRPALPLADLPQRAAPASDADPRGAALLMDAAAAPAVPGLVIGREALSRAGLALASPRAARSRTLEEITVAQQQILRAIQPMQPEEGRCSRLVLVTSARPGEGKTFCSLNIAASIAANGAAPVVLVDADAKIGSVSHLLGCAELPGLRHLAADAARRPASLLVPTEIERLSVLPYGARPEEAEPLPSGAMFAAALLRLGVALRGHILVVDASPCLATSDASAFAPVAGQVVMVVEAERTQRGEVEAALDLVDACPTLQLLLNRVRIAGADRFGAYGDYGTPPDGG